MNMCTFTCDAFSSTQVMYCSTQGWVMCYYTNQPLGGVWCHLQNLSASSVWWEQVRPHLKWCLYILEYTVIVVHSLEKTFDMLNLVILTVYPIKLQLHSLKSNKPAFHELPYKIFLSSTQHWPSTSPLDTGRLNHRSIIDSPGAGTRVCRELLLLPPSSLCCVFAGPACQTPTGSTDDEEHRKSLRGKSVHSFQTWILQFTAHRHVTLNVSPAAFLFPV